MKKNTLYHFECENCDFWWLSISENHEICPQCSDNKPEPIKSNRKFSESIKYLNQKVLHSPLTPKYKVLHAWTTYNGQWDTGSSIYSVEQWAIDLYLGPNSGSDGFGGETHIFARVQDKNGNHIDSSIDFKWPDGAVSRMTNNNGWANTPITGSFSPERGESGFWTVSAGEDSEEFGRFALPNNHHVSLYVVFEIADA